MKRMIHSIIFLAVIVLVVFISMRVSSLSFSQENVHYASERGFHYGPSDDILFKYTGEDGKGLVIGKCGDEGLSVTHTKRYLGFLYKVDNDVFNAINMTEPTTFVPCEKEISIFQSPDKDLIYGICYDDQTSQITLEMGTENDEYFAQNIELDKNGFFYITDVSSLYNKDEVIYTDPPYYIYAESKSSVDGSDIRVNSNLTKGQIINKTELDKIIPERDDFMSPENMNNTMNFTGDELNKINAGIKKYTGIDFFATGGWADGETVQIHFVPNIWKDRELMLTFFKDGTRFVPIATDGNMDTAAIGWLRTNYGRSYRVENIISDKISVTEKNGKRQM